MTHSEKRARRWVLRELARLSERRNLPPGDLAHHPAAPSDPAPDRDRLEPAAAPRRPA